MYNSFGIYDTRQATHIPIHRNRMNIALFMVRLFDKVYGHMIRSLRCCPEHSVVKQSAIVAD